MKNGFADYPFLGAVRGWPATNDSLSEGSYNYAFFAGTASGESVFPPPYFVRIAAHRTQPRADPQLRVTTRSQARL